VILVTGASGFVGSALVDELAQLGVAVRACYRTDKTLPRVNVDLVSGIDLLSMNDLKPVLSGVSVIVHTAARVHVMQERSDNPLEAFRRMNVDATLRLARQAAAFGVKRFVYISSIKVNGEQTLPGQKFTADMTPNPSDAYGISKFEAENGLLSLAKETGIEVVIIRPPLVYGPGVKANFAKMMTWVAKGIPLPFGSIDKNCRSMVGLGNLVNLLILCTSHPKAANQVLLVSDDDDLSTAGLIRALGHALGRSAHLLPVPESFLSWGARLLGMKSFADRLLGNLQVDITKTKELLDWHPPFTVAEELKKTVLTKLH
jgi:nucleoside-diphosphate-sugar epimerase